MAAAVSTLIFCPLAFQGSRAAVADTSSVSSSAVPLGDLERAAREHCPDARRGLAFYRSAAHRWRLKMGAATTGNEAVTSRAGAGTSARPLACPQIHRAVKFSARRLRRTAGGTRRGRMTASTASTKVGVHPRARGRMGLEHGQRLLGWAANGLGLQRTYGPSSSVGRGSLIAGRCGRS